MRRVLLLLAVALGGCVAPPNPDPTLHLEASGVELLAVAREAAFGGGLPVSWRVHNPTGAPMEGTGLRYGPSSILDGANLTHQSYPFLASSATESGVFTAVIPANLSTLHLRAWVALGGETWWSAEATVAVTGAPFGDPEVVILAAEEAEAGIPLAVRWRASNSSAGLAELHALAPAGPDGQRQPGSFRVGAPLNGTAATFRRELVLPYPGNWTLRAAINVSGAVVAANTRAIVVREPAAPNAAWIAPPAASAPGQRLELTFRINGPGTTDTEQVAAGAQVTPAQPLGNRTFRAAVFAPAAGRLEARAQARVDGVLVESAPLAVEVVAQPGPWAVSLLSYLNQTVPSGQVRVLFRVVGPPGNATFAGVHAGNRSAEGPPSALSPANYTAGTAAADGAGAGGRWPVPSSFSVNLTAPAKSGVFWLRARVVIDGVAYWSSEGSVRVQSA